MGYKSTLQTWFKHLNFKWDITCIDQLQKYMKLCYKVLLDVFEEIEEEMCKDGRLDCVYYAKVAVRHY